MLIGAAIIVAAVILWLTAKSIGPTVQEGLVMIASWSIAMVMLASPYGVQAREWALARIPANAKSVILTIALFAFVAALAVAWHRFREQKSALQKLLPPPPKTSFKKRLDKGL